MSQELTIYGKFEMELATRGNELVNVLPPHLSPEQFTTAALIAVKHNPELLLADRRSLHQAVTEAAEDGLKPDGREGVITIYKEKRKRKNENGVTIEEWIEACQWNPMLFGIRKRALEVAGIIINAEVVHEKDHFRRVQGDEPRLEHEPPKLGVDRGQPVGVYAIFKRGQEVLHREVMDVQQIEDVRSQSKNKDGLMWKKFWTEAWKKTVVRRGIKTVPSVPDLERIIKRVDRDFDFDRKPALARQEVVAAIEHGDTLIAEDVAPGPDKAVESDPAPAAASTPAAKPTALQAFQKALAECQDVTTLNSIWEMFDKTLRGEDRKTAITAFEARFGELSK